MQQTEQKHRSAHDSEPEQEGFVERTTSGDAAGDRKKHCRNRPPNHFKSSGHRNRVPPFGSFVVTNAYTRPVTTPVGFTAINVRAGTKASCDPECAIVKSWPKLRSHRLDLRSTGNAAGFLIGPSTSRSGTAVLARRLTSQNAARIGRALVTRTQAANSI